MANEELVVDDAAAFAILDLVQLSGRAIQAATVRENFHAESQMLTDGCTDRRSNWRRYWSLDRFMLSKRT